MGLRIRVAAEHERGGDQSDRDPELLDHPDQGASVTAPTETARSSADVRNLRAADPQGREAADLIWEPATSAAVMPAMPWACGSPTSSAGMVAARRRYINPDPGGEGAA